MTRWLITLLLTINVNGPVGNLNMLSQLFHYHSRLVRTRVKRWLSELEASKPLEPSVPDRYVALYLHIPFCVSLCKFCHFVRYPFNEDVAKKYYKKLIEDVYEAYSKGFKVNEVYIGGGSPSVMPEMLGELIDVLWELWKARISVEVNPNDVVERSAVEYIDPKKVERISMGVQSLTREGLKALGRASTLENTLTAVEAISSRGFKTFNIDLVWGTKLLMKGIRKAFELGANQVTFYPLMPFPLTGAKGEAKGFEMYEEIVKEAFRKGFVRANAWTFNKGFSIVDEYIADSINFLGLGVSSFSLLGNIAHINTFDVSKYLSSNWFPVEHSKRLSLSELRQFYLAYKLHSEPPKSLGEAGWYLGVITLREMYTVLGNFRIRHLVKLSPKETRPTRRSPQPKPLASPHS